MRPLYIFDLDGTLALIEHRRHFVEGDKKDWRAFFAACVDDEPNMPVINTLNCLSNVGADIWIWSGPEDFPDFIGKGWQRRIMDAAQAYLTDSTAQSPSTAPPPELQAAGLAP